MNPVFRYRQIKRAITVDAIHNPRPKTMTMTTTTTPAPRDNIQCILFDADDTLIHAAPILQQAERHQAAHILQHFPAVAAFHTLTSSDTSNKLQTLQLTAAKYMQNAPGHDLSSRRAHALALLAQHANHHDPQHFAETVLQQFLLQRRRVLPQHIPHGTLQTLAQLKARGYRLAVLTNGNSNLAEAPLFRGLFEFCLNCEHLPAAKPDASAFNAAVHAFGTTTTTTTTTHAVLHVGDSRHSDVHGALNAGMHACWLRLPSSHDHHDDDDDDDLAHPRFIGTIHALPDLLHLLPGVPDTCSPKHQTQTKMQYKNTTTR